MQRRSRVMVPIVVLVVGMLASVGTSSAARVCLEDEFGGQFNLNGDGGVLTGLFSILGEPVAVVTGSRARLDEGTVYGLHSGGEVHGGNPRRRWPRVGTELGTIAGGF